MCLYKRLAIQIRIIAVGVWAVLALPPVAIAQQIVTSGPVLTLDLSRYDNQHIQYITFPSLVGILDGNTLVTSKADFDGHAFIDFWNLENGSIKWKVPLPASVEDILISPNGHYLLAHESEVITATSYYHPRWLFVWDITQEKLIRTIDIGQKAHVYTSAFLPGRSDEIIQIAREGKVNRLLYINLNTGCVYKRLDYPNGTMLHRSDILFSPDGKCMACVYAVSEISPNCIDFFDVGTGKLRQTYQGDFNEHAVDNPCFFLSNRRFAVGDFVYNLRTKKTTLLFQPHHQRETCISGVPSHPGYAFYLSKQGLELWNIPRRKFLRRWTQIKQVDRIYFLRHNTLFGTFNEPHEGHERAIVQCWKFD